MLALVVSLQVKHGHRDPFLEAITENARRSFTDEPGCRYFDVTVDTADDHHFVFYELYADQAALDTHSRSETMKAMGPVLAGLLGAPPEFTLATPVAGKDTLPVT